MSAHPTIVNRRIISPVVGEIGSSCDKPSQRPAARTAIRGKFAVGESMTILKTYLTAHKKIIGVRDLGVLGILESIELIRHEHNSF